MKQRYFFLTLFTLLVFSNNLFGQQICNTPEKTSNNFLNTSSFLRTAFNDDSYCLKIYFHVIRRNDGTGGQSISAVNQAFQILNQDFDTHNISFSWDNTIDYIDNTTYFDNPVYGPVVNGEITYLEIFNINNHQDGIDIYLFDDVSTVNSAQANGVAESSELFISGSFQDQSLATSRIISHEMGHVLFLWHTHYGTSGEGNNEGACPEYVNGSNSDICGDYVEDTPADPGINYGVDSSCQYLNNGSDYNGDNIDVNNETYSPDELNIMSYSTPQCLTYFTPLQGLRMRNSIQSLPFLQQTLVNCGVPDAIDLFIKDTNLDLGDEPNLNPNSTFLSQDIWVRHNPDGLTNTTHQTPITNTNNYVYVRVRNRGTIDSNGNDKLHLYWSSWGLKWSNHWINHTVPTMPNANNILFGDEVGDVTIPTILPSEEIILEFNMDFNPAFPGLYGSYYKLLTRIVSVDDTIVSESTNVQNNILNNNNIASKNVYVSNDNAPFSRTVTSINNPTTSVKTYRFEFKKNDTELGKAIYEEAEIHIELSPDLYNAWNNGSKQGSNFRTTSIDSTIIATDNNLILDNVTLQPNKPYDFNLTCHFLTKEVTDKNNFGYIVTQHDTDTNELIDLTNITIQKVPRPIFIAFAGDDKDVDENETITISAEQINEAAIYNWYDTDGNLIYTGKDLTVSIDVTKKYNLEIVAETDGYKDYDEVEVKLKPSIIESISPNPATNQIQVNYKLNGVNSAYLMIVGQSGSNNTSNNYVLDTSSNQITINLLNYINGYYTIALVCDGDIVDAKMIIKQ